MILNPSDPTGLFSKCARSQASKIKPYRPATACRAKTMRSPDVNEKKKLLNSSSFLKQQSREQRQSKYKKDQTPPIGQYNPIKKEGSKFVWDILKVFHRQNKQKQSVSVLKHPQSQKKMQSISVKSIDEPQQKQIEAAASHQSTTNNIIQSSTNNLASLGQQTTLMSSSVTKSQCMVDMSRMTGRKILIKESCDQGNINILQSLASIKKNVTKNIYFAKQPKKSIKKYETINAASDYSYDYSILKPKKNGLVNFSTVRGRDWSIKAINENSYQHYEYDSYVWSGKSKIFPNTKTHLIDFNKQSNRYKKKENSQQL